MSNTTQKELYRNTVRKQTWSCICTKLGTVQPSRGFRQSKIRTLVILDCCCDFNRLQQGRKHAQFTMKESSNQKKISCYATAKVLEKLIFLFIEKKKQQQQTPTIKKSLFRISAQEHFSADGNQ